MTKHFILEKIRTAPKPMLVFVGVLLLGIFIRTYNFHDWLRMNADQARDAATVSAVVEGNAPLPLLGPKAGGTDFKLGPVFYYFEIASAKIFGNYPDKMAYADLLFSLLAIPLLFHLMRRYFSYPTAVSLVALYAASFYAVKYSRFAWNPNSTPFWTMVFLFALLEVFSPKENRKYLWAIVAGVAVGVGVQLHTFLLAALPLLTVLAFGYAAWRDRRVIRYFLVVLLVSLFLNIPQFIHEAQTNGENIKAFFGGVKTKQESTVSYLDKIVHTGACFTAANIQIVSSAYYDNDTCDIADASQAYTLPIGLAGLVFFFGGVALAVRAIRRETDHDRRLFLGLLSAYIALLFLLIIPVAFEISLRYFLILAWMPFFLFGLWLDFIGERLGTVRKTLPIILIFLVLFTTNLVAIGRNFKALAGYATSTDAGGFDIVYLGETERMAKYISASAGGARTVLIGGNKGYLFKAQNALAYFVRRDGISFVPVDKNKQDISAPAAYLISTKTKTEFINSLAGTTGTIDSRSFGRFTIVMVKVGE